MIRSLCFRSSGITGFETHDNRVVDISSAQGLKVHINERSQSNWSIDTNHRTMDSIVLDSDYESILEDVKDQGTMVDNYVHST